MESQLYENGVSKGSKGEESSETTYSPLGGKVTDKSEKKGNYYVTVMERNWNILCPFKLIFPSQTIMA